MSFDPTERIHMYMAIFRNTWNYLEILALFRNTGIIVKCCYIIPVRREVVFPLNYCLHCVELNSNLISMLRVMITKRMYCCSWVRHNRSTSDRPLIHSEMKSCSHFYRSDVVHVSSTIRYSFNGLLDIQLNALAAPQFSISRVVTDVIPSTILLIVV